jgi:hypothetical protein
MAYRSAILARTGVCLILPVGVSSQLEGKSAHHRGKGIRNMATASPSPRSLEKRLAQLERLLADQQQEIAQQRERIARQDARLTEQDAEIERLRATPAPLPPRALIVPDYSVPPPPAAPDTSPEVPAEQRPRSGAKSRRALLKLGGAAAAVGVAAVAAAAATELAHPGTAHAHSDTITFQQTASGSGNVAIEGDGTSGARGITGTSDSDIGVYGQSTSGTAVYGQSTSGAGVRGSGFTGVLGFGTSGSGVEAYSTSGIGVYGQSTSNSGVTGHSTSGTGVYATTTSGSGVIASGAYGGLFYGTVAPLALGPHGGAGAPTSGTHYAGEIYPDGNTTLWVCVSGDGSGVGTWARLTGVANGTPGGALNYLSAPIRLFDSRMGTNAPLPSVKGALAGQSTTTIQVTGTLVGGLSVPAGATGVFGNLTVTNTQGPGDLILWPHGATQPTTSNINYGPGQTVANSFNVGLNSGGAMDLFVHVSGTDVIIDVAGYVL